MLWVRQSGIAGAQRNVLVVPNVCQQGVGYGHCQYWLQAFIRHGTGSKVDHREPVIVVGK